MDGERERERGEREKSSVDRDDLWFGLNCDGAIMPLSKRPIELVISKANELSAEKGRKTTTSPLKNLLPSFYERFSLSHLGLPFPLI